MAHSVESMFYVKETPWHGLGERLEEAPTISEAIEQSGLDWEVGLKNLVTVDGDSVTHKATYRKDTNNILGVVGPRYVPLQNKEAFDWFQPFIDNGEASLNTGGSLHSGEKVWVLAKLNRDNSQITKNDEVEKFILLSNSHNGTTAIRVGYTPIRVVCANTLAFATQHKSSNLMRIRHTRNTGKHLENIRDIMNNIDAEFESTADQYRFLASRSYNTVSLKKYIKTVMGVADKPEEDIKTRTRTLLDKVLELSENTRNSMPGVGGTWWGAYNAYNEYLNYSKGRTNDNRMDSLWFGTSANDNKRALDYAMEFAESTV